MGRGLRCFVGVSGWVIPVFLSAGVYTACSRCCCPFGTMWALGNPQGVTAMQVGCVNSCRLKRNDNTNEPRRGDRIRRVCSAALRRVALRRTAASRLPLLRGQGGNSDKLFPKQSSSVAYYLDCFVLLNPPPFGHPLKRGSRQAHVGAKPSESLLWWCRGRDLRLWEVTKITYY